MQHKRLFFLYLLFFVFLSQAVFADPLLLSKDEMQKLQKYFPANDGQHLSWKGDPLVIQLPLNQEKRIIFPTSVTPDLKSALTTDQLKMINNDKSLYITALKPFTTTRMYVTAQSSGEVMLIDISTDDKADNSATTIDIKQNNSNQPITTSTINNSQTLSDSSDDDNAVISDNDAYVTLTRFAWQQLFSPSRLLDNSLGITRAPMHTQPMVSSLIYGDKVYAHPAISWVYNNTYVTAVELRNKYPHSSTINVNRDLCGNWQAATLYPRSTLKPSGDKPNDSTMLLLISKKPFGESMEVCDGHA